MRLYLRKDVIRGCEARGDGNSPYLTRFLLLGTRLGKLRLHVFHRSDADDLHDHPWDFVSLVLWRGYVEETPAGRKRVWPGMLLVRRAEHRHRVMLVRGKCAVTLIWTCRDRRVWGFFRRGTETSVPWQQYFRENGC